MQELDMFTMEWSGMIQFDTAARKILINTDRKEVAETLVFKTDINGTMTLYVNKRNENNKAK